MNKTDRVVSGLCLQWNRLALVTSATSPQLTHEHISNDTAPVPGDRLRQPEPAQCVCVRKWPNVDSLHGGRLIAGINW